LQRIWLFGDIWTAPNYDMLNDDLTFLEAMNWKDRKWLESKKERMSHDSDRSERNQEIGEDVMVVVGAWWCA
jgi:hypothetical protein